MAGFTKSLTSLAGVVTDFLDNPKAIRNLALGIVPTAAALELVNLEPTGEVIGNFIKNITVPALEEYNVKRDIELEAQKELGAKHVPTLTRNLMETQQLSAVRQQAIDEALKQSGKIVSDIQKDPYLQNVDAENLKVLVKDAIKVAPHVFTENRSLALSVIRAAALSGADTIDPQTAMTLTDLEKRYTGGL